jgi:hypothetical protein
MRTTPQTNIRPTIIARYASGIYIEPLTFVHAGKWLVPALRFCQFWNAPVLESKSRYPEVFPLGTSAMRPRWLVQLNSPLHNDTILCLLHLVNLDQFSFGQGIGIIYGREVT